MTKRRKVFTLLAIVLCVALLGTTIGITLSKYAKHDETDAPTDAKQFYFESDMLALEGATYDLGIDSVRFELKNFADNKRVSAVDYNFELSIRCTDGSALSTEVRKEKSEETDSFTANTKKTVVVEYTGLVFGKTYEITASCNAPYKKTISATFKISEMPNSLSYKVEDYGDYVDVIVKTNELSALIDLYWQDGYVPYNAQPALAGATGNSVFNMKLETYSAYYFRFFKSNLDTVFEETDFYVVISKPDSSDDQTSSDMADVPGGVWDR